MENDLINAKDLANYIAKYLLVKGEGLGVSEVAHLRGLLARLSQSVAILERRVAQNHMHVHHDVYLKEVTGLKNRLNLLKGKFDEVCLTGKFDHAATEMQTSFKGHDAETMKQDQLLWEQDQHLDHLEGSVQTLNVIGHAISDEVGVHQRLLETTDNSVNQLKGQLQDNQKTLSSIIKSGSNSWVLIIILVLFVALAILVLR